MKNLTYFISLLLVFGSSIVFGQVPYADALNLGKHLDTTKKELKNNQQVIEILKKYLEPNDDIIRAFNKASDDSDPNPFIEINLRIVENKASNIESTAKHKDVFSAIGGLDVTNIADGLAKFLVQRTKKELSLAFFEQFKEDLDTIEELKVLFPKTHSLLLAIDEEIYNFSAYINMLRETFEDDLKNSIGNLRKMTEEVERIKQHLDSNQTLGFILYNSLLIAEELQNGKHPGDVISTLKNEGRYSKGIQNFDPSVETLDLFSQSLRSKQESKFWIGPDSLKLLIKNENTFILYLGLVYQQAKDKDIRFAKNDSGTVTFIEVMDSVASNINSNKDPIKSFIKGISEHANSIDEKLTTIKRKKKDNLADYTDYYDFYNSSLKFMEQIAGIAKIPAFSNKINYDDKNLKKYFEIAYTAGEMYLDVNEKRYYAAVLDLTVIIDQIVPDCASGGEEGLACNYAQVVLPKILKYGNLAASLVKAENSDDAQAIIESIALPAGSSSIKRRSKRTWSLNAYVGLSAGAGYNTLSTNYAFQTGVIAPIGAEFSWGRDKFDSNGNIQKRGSCSIFIPLIDIGAVTTFRFGDEETSEVPTITLENIFSPGLFYVYGCKNKPVSFGIGGQLSPRLHQVNIDGNMINEGANLALKVFLAVDIPLLNFKSIPLKENRK
jgi:hypothetical protein